MNQNNSLTVSIFFQNKLSNYGTRLPLINEKYIHNHRSSLL